MTIKQTIIISLFWKFLERGGTQAIQFIISIVLARILSPSDFGLIALVMVFIAIANVFVQSGFNSALIQKKNADNLDFSSIFYLSLAVAALMYSLLFFAAPWIAAFYDHVNLIPVIRVLGCTLFLQAFNSIQEAYIVRNMLFKKLFFRSIAAAIPSGILGVTLAFSGFGVWALVVQQLSNAFLISAVMWFTVKWRPQLLFSLGRIKDLFSFGGNLFMSALLDVGYNNIQGLIIGKMFSPAILGFYKRGSQFPNLIVSNINTSIQSVMLPSFASIQDDRAQVKKMMRRAVVTSSFLILPMMAILAAVANPLVKIVLGEKWLPCVPFLQIYCFIYAFWPIHTSNLSAINALGHSDIFLKLEIIKRCLGFSVLIATILLFRTPIAIALGSAFAAVISGFINAHPNKKLLNYGYLEQIEDILPYFVVSIVVGSVIWGLSWIRINDFLLLILQIVIGCSIYGGAAKLLHFDSFDYIVNTFREFKKNGK